MTYKYNAQKNIFFIAVVEKNIQIMEKIAKDLLNTAPVVSKLLKTTIDYLQYLQFLEHIVIFIKSEKQLEVIKNLINTITINLMNLAHFAGILSNAKEYEAVIIILEYTLLNPQPPTLVSDGEEKEALYRCRTNLWSAYINTKIHHQLKSNYCSCYKTNQIALNLSVKKQLKLKLMGTNVYSQIYCTQTNKVNY
ncbi:hypothetical protein [Candidatus Rickettsia kedanie]|uniref:Uncharacterized protein n=1 Tax=Candidatus Rickettsia kedanie TaxID=3115352 RepID=A0ABP9TUK3_9RICK